MNYRFPTDGGYIKVTSPYGPRKSPINGQNQMHNGIDIVGFSEIYPTCEQVVTAVDYHSGRGYYVAAIDSERVVHIYQHLKAGSITCKAKDALEVGRPFALMGRTGDSTGVHLHYETRVGTMNGAVLNPATILGVDNKVGSYYQGNAIANDEMEEELMRIGIFTFDKQMPNDVHEGVKNGTCILCEDKDGYICVMVRRWVREFNEGNYREALDNAQPGEVVAITK